MFKFFTPLFFFIIFSSSSLFALFVSNPSDPVLFKTGLYFGENKWVHVRLGYVTEYIYKNRCKLEFKREINEDSFSTMLNYYGIFTLNLFCRWDLYGIIGSSKMEIDNQIFPQRELAWGLGTKVLLFQTYKFDLSLDLKYFITEQKPHYYIIEEMLANIVYSKLYLDYQEWQVSLACSYKTDYFIPYIGLTYFNCKLSSRGGMYNLELPNIPYEFSLYYDSCVSRKNWGLVLGVTLIGCEKVSFTLENRNFDQSSINGSLQIQF